MSRCVKAEALVAKARSQGWRTEIEYGAGPLVLGYDDGSQRLVTEERVVIAIEAPGETYVITWGLNPATERWSLVEPPELRDAEGLWSVTLRYVEARVSVGMN